MHAPGGRVDRRADSRQPAQRGERHDAQFGGGRPGRRCIHAPVRAERVSSPRSRHQHHQRQPAIRDAAQHSWRLLMSYTRRGICALLAALTIACGGSVDAPAAEFDAARAMQRVEEQLAFGPRIPGTAGHAAMAAWLDSLARAGSDSVFVRSWTHVAATGGSVPLVNVIARFNPAAPRRLAYLAPWATRPASDGPASRDHSAPVPGANDGASGVAVLLGVMDALGANPPPAELGVDLVFVDGEDFGEFGPPRVDVLLGSSHYARNLPAPGRPEFAVVWDMVGQHSLRLGRESLGSIAAAPVVDLVWNTAAAMGY